MGAQFTEIDYQRSGSVGRLTLGRAEGRELTPTALTELHRALDLMDRDEQLRLLVVTGSGQSFCVGLDPDYARRTVALGHGFDRLIEDFLKPFVDFVARLSTVAEHVIAAVNGPCSAAGLWIVRACDYAVGPEPAATFAERVDELIDTLSAGELSSDRPSAEGLSRPTARAHPQDPSPAPSPHPSAVR
jgi:enoyl-CoA hydratase/carnithine racemase